MFFKGYVLTKNKKCLEKFKDVKKLKTLDDVKDLPEYAGILAENTVLIDVDDEEESEILFDIVLDKKLKCKVYKTTRGMHFYFLNNNTIKSNKTNTSLFCGLHADIKLGTRNSYSILKFNNIDREVLYDAKEYETVPKYLLPIKYNIDFIDMENGDGRNQKLFNYILTLQSHGFGVEESRECIRIINEYVMYDGLSDNELETILRDESFKKPTFFDGKTFLFDKFAEFLKNTYHIKSINDQLHLYQDGIYISNNAEIEKAMINYIPNLSKTKRNEVLEYIKLIVEPVNPSSCDYMTFRNGIYNLLTDELLDFDPSIITQNKINYDYNPNAYNELMDKTLDRLSCNDKEIRAIIEEMIGYCFFRRNELGVAFILTGDKKNDKSTLLGVLQKLIGDVNTSSLDLKELDQRFKAAELFGKLANIGDDIGDDFIPDTAIFKKLVTGDRINVERKGQQPFEFNSYAKLLFSANKIPRMKDRTGAIKRRLVIIPFEATFDKSDPDFDPYIKTKLQSQTSIEYLIQLGITGLKRVLKNNSFTQSDKATRELENYDKENNPILIFLDEIEYNDVINQSVSDVYLKYSTWCIENGFEKLNNLNFGKTICQKFNVKSKGKKVKGENIRVYVKGNKK